MKELEFITDFDRETEKKLKRLYKTALPPSERKPYSFIKKKVKEGKMRLIALSGGKGEFLGLMVLYFYKELVLLDYFAVENDARGKGIGSSALEKLRAEYEKARIVIEIEDTETDCAELAVRLRRKGFYLRHGAEVMEYKVMLYGVKMHILSIGGEVTFEEYYAILQDMWQRGVSRYVYETE